MTNNPSAAMMVRVITTALLEQVRAASDTTQSTADLYRTPVQRAYETVRGVLKSDENWWRAFEDFRKYPHHRRTRGELRRAIAEAMGHDPQGCLHDALLDVAKEKDGIAPSFFGRYLADALLGLCIFAAAILGFIPQGDWFGWNPAWSLVIDGFFRVAFLGLALLLWMRCASGLQKTRMARTHRGQPLNPVPARAVRKLQRDAGKLEVINAMQAEVLASSILWPGDTRVRVVETRTPDRNTVRQHVVVDVQLPLRDLLANGRSGANGSGSKDKVARENKDVDVDGTSSKRIPIELPEELKTLYFPVLVPRKGVLHDSLNVFDENGTRLHVLSYREYLELVAGMLHILLVQACEDLNSSKVKAAELCALEEIARRGRVPRDVGDEGPPPGFKQIGDLATVSRLKRMAAGLARKLRTHYAIIAVVSPNNKGRFTVTYEQSQIPKARSRRFAEALGARPLVLEVPLDNASLCQSYHLCVQCPDHLYLRHQELLASEETLQTVQVNAPTLVHHRFRRRLGQPYAHFYARFFPQYSSSDAKCSSDQDAEPLLRLEFCEVPPASVFRSAIAAVACFLLVWAIGAVISRRPDPGTDAPAILLAFPAVAAALLGFEKQSRNLLDSTLHARLSLIATAFFSILGSALFMAYKALSRPSDPNATANFHEWVDWPGINSGFSVLGVTSWLWIILTMLALLNAVVSLVVYAARFATFHYLSSRNGLQNDTEGDK